jgi:hypothetical protein
MDSHATLAQLAAEVAQLQQQVEQVNQRLDMIYGAVTRLAETISGKAISPAGNGRPRSAPFLEEPEPRAAGNGGKDGELPIAAAMMMGPGNMLESLRQHALKAGMDISAEAVERLKSNVEEDHNGAS